MSLVTLRNPETGEQVATEDPTPYVGWEQLAAGQLLADLQAELWERVKAQRAARLQLAPTPFGTAQIDVESKANISGLVQMATIAKAAEEAFAEIFTMADNSEVELDADEMIAFGVEVGTYVSAVHARARDLRASIDAASSAEDLAAIAVEDGWPS